MRRYLVFGLALVLVAGLLAVGVLVWHRSHRTPLEQALHAVPAGSERISFTDWSVVRQRTDVRLGSVRGHFIAERSQMSERDIDLG